LSASSSRLDPQSDARQESAAGGVERIKAGGRAEVFLTGRVVSFGGGRGHAEEGGARRGLRHDGSRMRRVEGGKWRERERVAGKAAGDERLFYTWPKVGLADEAGSDAIPDAAGGEGGHGAAKPHGVVHR
jgi:hypothetical protein